VADEGTRTEERRKIRVPAADKTLATVKAAAGFNSWDASDTFCIAGSSHNMNSPRRRYSPLTSEQWVDAVFHAPESLIQVSLQMTVRARCLPCSSAS
jgi:hypothetical protein